MDKAQASRDVADQGPPGVPPPPSSGRPRDEDRLTRKPLTVWDRIKFLLLLVLVWFVLVWSAMANNPVTGFSDAALNQVRTGWWVFLLLGLEALRQVHFFISERSIGYHRFWTETVFGGFERLTHRRISDWSRFRIWRMVTWVLWIAIIAIVIGKIIHTTPILALLRGPQLLWRALPFVLQLAFAFFFIAFQFIGLFWLLSRGGVDVYFPDDIKTRFSDVWGQDHVLQRVKENIIFLENPELVEERGGYVPGGLLLWGPPGTGKTLMAEAVAGETGKPYVFVDPGAFINMFFGVGVLKVKGLFRKLRRLALRYGGVIVFFDEADVLGNRGGAVAGGGVGGRWSAGASPGPFSAGGCHGFSYLSPGTQWLLTGDAMRGGAEQPGIQVRKQIVGAG
ncbi:MAG TPA: AAA family ATPase, partial [Streptosporangiaceae bacterium]|nr:AAA family ATPase [Streptosporangiaceae bacterium]